MVQPTHPDDNDLAQTRTSLAEERTALAHERTYSAWLRTGIGALAAGIAVEKFLDGVLPPWNIRLVAMILILLSAFAFVAGSWRHGCPQEHLAKSGATRLPQGVVRLVGTALVLASVLALTGIWILSPLP